MNLRTWRPLRDGGRLALFLFGLVAGIFPIFESDIFWHLAAGKWMVAHRGVPDHDPFRFSSGGAAWVDHEWLFQLVVHGVERLGGLPALLWLRAGALGLFSALLFGIARRAAIPPALAGLLAIGGVLGVRPRFLLRPEIVTLFAILALLLLLERWARSREAGGERGRSSHVLLVALVLLVGVWVNLHGEALLAPGLAFLFLLGRSVDRDLAPATSQRPAEASIPATQAGARDWRIVFTVPLLLAVALLATPYGWRLVEVPLGIRAAMADLPAVNPEWMSALRAPQPYLFAGFAAVAVIALRARAYHPSRPGRMPALAWGLPTLAMGVLALSAVRHQALFFAVGTPFAAHCLGLFPQVRELVGSSARRWNLGVTIFGTALALWCAFPPQSGPLRPRHGGLVWGFGVDAGRFPVALAGKLERRPEVGPLYNELVHGGYLLWRAFPPRQVFIDGRMELDPHLLHEVARARESAASWAAMLERRGARGALVPFDDRLVPIYASDEGGRTRQIGAETAHTLLFPPERFVLADWDDAGMLFLTHEEAERAWPDATYRFVFPENPQRTIDRAALDPAFRENALAEVRRKLGDAPGDARALWLAERLD